MQKPTAPSDSQGLQGSAVYLFEWERVADFHASAKWRRLVRVFLLGMEGVRVRGWPEFARYFCLV